MNLPQAKLEEWVAMYVEGRCGPDELRALETLLLADAGNRDDFLETVLLAQDLEMLSGQRPLKQVKCCLPVEIVLARQRMRAVRISLLGAAALVLLSAAVLWYMAAPRHTATLASFRAAPDSIFALTHAGGDEATAGKGLHAGSRIVIEHGVVELELPHEVRTVIEAPAAVTLVDERTLEFEHGRAFFEVSSVEGRGFTVITPQQRIVDLGTAFALDKKIGRDEVELHVLEGRVRVDSLGGGEGEILTATRSVLLAGARVREELDGPPADFRRELPSKIKTLLDEDFGSGLLAGREYAVFMDPTAVRDLSGNPFAGITESHPWSFRTARPRMTSVSFHDFGGVPSPGHITTQLALDETVDLVHFADGVDTGIDFTIQGGNGILMRDAGEILPPAAGTPAAELFLASGINLNTGSFHDSEHRSPGPAVFHFASLDPALRYDIALYGDRSGIPSDGKERFTLQGAEAAENRSSTGIVSTLVTEMETRPNASVGHVVRWTGIASGSDGAVSIEIDPSISGDENIAYLSAVRVAVATTDGMPVDFNGLPIDATAPVAGDDVAGEAGTATAPATSLILDEMEGLSGMGRDLTPPTIIAWQPARNASEAMPVDRLTLTFDKPVELGTGRIFFRNVTDWREAEIAVGGPRTSVEGEVLTIIPPVGLADGEVEHGGICGWVCSPGVGIFNPGADGPWYAHADLNDKSRARGVIGSMRGPILATFGECRADSAMRREIGMIAPDSRYTISAAIGVRAGEASVGTLFDGYAIRLTSGGTILAELSNNTPPGPPNSVTGVGFAWDSSYLPEGVSIGGPLTLEIAPNQASGDAPGYLDIDNVRVTVVGK